MNLHGVALISIAIFLCDPSAIMGAFASSSFDDCLPNERPCQNGQCLEATKFCNGYPECGDGSDEMGCPQQYPASMEYYLLTLFGKG